MLVKIPEPWTLATREETPESVFRNRRRILGGMIAAGLLPRIGAADETPKAPGAARNPAYVLDRPLTEEKLAAGHNIFDEFSGKRDDVAEATRRFRTRPWTLHIGGQVAKPLTLDVDELITRLGQEERLYRHRCVEAWSMAVPWTGIPLRRLVELAQPTAKARYLRLLSFARPEEAPAWYATKRVFPYYEALMMSEATNELAFLATGIYGHTLPGQHGAPIRLVVPWKYGFKSIKSIVALQFTEQRPGTFWNDLSPGNYSFLSNVDPSETIPWPQNEETPLGTDEKRPTLPFNGYGSLVASLYA
jgi:methionine sulfoxide reductase catalytic subunit